MEAVLRILTVGVGVLMMFMDFSFYAHKKLTNGMGLLWGGVSLIIILLGAVTPAAGWVHYINIAQLPAFIAFFFSLIMGAFYSSIKISKLIRKNQELAMHVSILNEENERIIKQIDEIIAKSADDATHKLLTTGNGGEGYE